jgi:hypothetical protein
LHVEYIMLCALIGGTPKCLANLQGILGDEWHFSICLCFRVEGLSYRVILID